MESSYALMTDLAVDLRRRFDGGLALERHGDTVRWTYCGAAAVVSLGPAGTLDATFLEAPARDAVTEETACCAYRSVSRLGYGLTRDGCRRMVDDMTDFFSGTREPRFVFVGTA